MTVRILTHAIRYWRRPRSPRRILCQACIRQSMHHPAGLRRNYTRNRLAGHPVCVRHSITEAIELLPYHGIQHHP